MNALQYLEATQIEEISSQYQNSGYQVVVSPLELGAPFETSSHSYDLIATKCCNKQAVGVTMRGQSGKSVEGLMELREQAHQEGFDTFVVGILSAPPHTEGEIEGLEQGIFDHLVVNIPEQLAELPVSVQVESMGQIGLSDVAMMLDRIRVVGSGVVEVGLENGYGRNAEHGKREFAFPLSFDVELDHDLRLKHVHDIAANTAGFYKSPPKAGEEA